MRSDLNRFHLEYAERFATAMGDLLVTPNAEISRYDIAAARDHILRLTRMLRVQMDRDSRRADIDA